VLQAQLPVHRDVGDDQVPRVAGDLVARQAGRGFDQWWQGHVRAPPQIANPMARSSILPSSVIRSGLHGGVHTQLISTSWMPSMPTSAAFAAPSIMSVSG